jgi:hypothetical protein
MVALAGADLDPPETPARLLGHFDPLLLGHRDRELVLDAGCQRR